MARIGAVKQVYSLKNKQTNHYPSEDLKKHIAAIQQIDAKNMNIESRFLLIKNVFEGQEKRSNLRHESKLHGSFCNRARRTRTDSIKLL